ncbi:hypothetical protein [Streptomyces sp. B6B3]|uniref:hypothetical protein n=1 Tax=Streptomyces sp. B6B3 TaxID=3153570 RepID=UPI00325E64D4
MTGEHQEAAERLAVVCAYLGEIRRDLLQGPGGDEVPMEQVLTAAQSGGNLAGPLAVLHAVLQAGGDPLGLDGYSDNGQGLRSLRPVGISDDRPGERVYLCPTSRCARYWWPQATVDVPHCAISGTALRRDRL